MDEKQSVMQKLYLDPYMVQDPDALDHIIEDVKGRLFKEVSKKIAEGVCYKVLYRKSTVPTPTMNEVTLILDLEPLRIKHMEAVYTQPEDIYLCFDERSLKEKLRNCIRYLKDRNGVRIEWRERK